MLVGSRDVNENKVGTKYVAIDGKKCECFEVGVVQGDQMYVTTFVWNIDIGNLLPVYPPFDILTGKYKLSLNQD